MKLTYNKLNRISVYNANVIIIIAHRPATIENVDKILKVEDGKVIQ